MERLIITLSLLYSCFAIASSPYQIDLIVFAHPIPSNGIAVDTPLIPLSTHAIVLRPDVQKTAKPYRLLSSYQSSLRDEYYLLNHKSRYQILGHYSWKQPGNNQNSVALPLIDHNGWQMQGTLNIKQSNFYTFNAELQISPPNHPQSAFTVSQKQRLQNNVIYYLDNPQIGMLVKIHQLS